jgi:hypothetical protein
LDSGLRRNDGNEIFLVWRVVVLNTCGAVLTVLAEIGAGMFPPRGCDPLRGPSQVRFGNTCGAVLTVLAEIGAGMFPPRGCVSPAGAVAGALWEYLRLSFE